MNIRLQEFSKGHESFQKIKFKKAKRDLEN